VHRPFRHTETQSNNESSHISFAGRVEEFSSRVWIDPGHRLQPSARSGESDLARLVLAALEVTFGTTGAADSISLVLFLLHPVTDERFAHADRRVAPATACVCVRSLQPQAITAQCARPGPSDSDLARLAVSSIRISSSIRSSACGVTACYRLQSHLRCSVCRLGSSSSSWPDPLIGSVE